MRFLVWINDESWWLFTSIIILLAIVVYVWINKQADNNQLANKKRWIEFLPSLISTLGVLGTFGGITLGLALFDTDHLDVSIPKLLYGLRTAFLTSLAGMIGSMILSRKVSSLYDKEDKGVSDANQAAAVIARSVESMKNDNANALQEVKNEIKAQTANQNSFYADMNAFVKGINSYIVNQRGFLQELLNNSDIQKDTLITVSASLNKIANNEELPAIHSDLDKLLVAFGEQGEKVQNMDENLKILKTSISNTSDDVAELKKLNQDISGCLTGMTDTLGEIATATEATSSTEDSILEKFDTFGKFIGDEVDDIERKMGETNTLLTNKFDEFSELLKKSNTEALVGVMKQLTTEFQKQMNGLIQRLVQENFEQLNKSVERLNAWQQENKNMIASLIQQYKDMETDFENSSTTLTKVSADTKALVGDGGKLQELIAALNKVILENQSYIEVTKKLQETAELTKDNMVKFDDSTNKLNDWVRKQRNFVDGVQMLIAKLEEIAKIKDYGGEFWKETKSKMEEGVGIIRNGSKEIENQISGLDQHFYQRLSATLAQLDACIQAMVEAANKNK